MELISLGFFALFIGVRHGLDGDHVAAIADMIGSEVRRRRQVALGMLYALGHGSIVFLIGLLSLLLGINIPEQALTILEMLVAVTLLMLGCYIVFTLFRRKEDYKFQGITFLIKKVVTNGKNKSDEVVSPILIGFIGATVIGVIHGIGVESPTQLFILTQTVGIGNYFIAMMQLILFVIGILISTICITFLVSYGFMKAQLQRKIYIIIGSVTGIYSIGLGTTMILNIL